MKIMKMVKKGLMLFKKHGSEEKEKKQEGNKIEKSEKVKKGTIIFQKK